MLREPGAHLIALCLLDRKKVAQGREVEVLLNR